MLQLEFLHWSVSGKPTPPPRIAKYAIIKGYLVRQKFSVVIETGTYLGDFIAYMLSIDSVSDIYSIEISPRLYDVARKRFSKVTTAHISLGDSRIVLPRLLASISTPCLFWLDAHYSAGITSGAKEKSPILEELGIILDHSYQHALNHLIIADDARLFVGSGGYPTIQEVGELVRSRGAGWVVEVRSDMIHVHSPEMVL